jgi:hypothetical protein
MHLRTTRLYSMCQMSRVIYITSGLWHERYPFSYQLCYLRFFDRTISFLFVSYVVANIFRAYHNLNTIFARHVLVGGAADDVLTQQHEVALYGGRCFMSGQDGSEHTHYTRRKRRHQRPVHTGYRPNRLSLLSVETITNREQTQLCD